jgi:DNA-binding CsgD family transcriptional regulator
MTAAVVAPRSTVLTDVGRETSKQLTEAEAIELTAQIRVKVEETLPLIRRAFQRRADLALDYPSWDAYCDAEFSGLRLSVADRREAVAGLRQDGMSTRAIASGLRVDQKTVRNDLAQVRTNSSPDGEVSGSHSPATVTGTDGKQHPASRLSPKRAEAPPPAPSRTSRRTSCAPWLTTAPMVRPRGRRHS